jgi:plasmid replication initiation protein
MTSQLVVTKDNKLTQDASYDLSISEQRVILLCIAKLDSRAGIPDKDGFKITVDDFSKELGIDNKAVYRDLKAAAIKLYNRSIRIGDAVTGSNARWIYKEEHDERKGEITLYFTPEIMPYLTELKGKFTSYKLKDVANFESSYSFRFYELLASWKGKEELTVEVSWIRKSLNLGVKYPQTGDLKRYVVLPAVADINKFSNLNVELGQVKKGREINKFIFKYAPKKTEPPKITKAYVEKHARPGESYQQATERLSNINGLKRAVTA